MRVRFSYCSLVIDWKFTTDANFFSSFFGDAIPMIRANHNIQIELLFALSLALSLLSVSGCLDAVRVISKRWFAKWNIIFSLSRWCVCAVCFWSVSSRKLCQLTECVSVSECFECMESFELYSYSYSYSINSETSSTTFVFVIVVYAIYFFFLFSLIRFVSPLA